jgi:hypothetical protein
MGQDESSPIRRAHAQQTGEQLPPTLVRILVHEQGQTVERGHLHLVRPLVAPGVSQRVAQFRAQPHRGLLHRRVLEVGLRRRQEQRRIGVLTVEQYHRLGQRQLISGARALRRPKRASADPLDQIRSFPRGDKHPDRRLELVAAPRTDQSC